MDIFEAKVLNDEDFLFFKEKIFDLSGIHLSEAKKTLIQARLHFQLELHQLESFAEYRAYLEKLPKSDPEFQKFVNLLTTNKTDWFREIEHFNYLEMDFIPQWLKSGKKNLRIWSAASSTGEEAYSIAMLVERLLKGTGKNFEIVGSDIDTSVLAKAQNGVYKNEQLKNIPKEFHHYFVKGTGEISEWMKISNSIKKFVSFEQFNLINDEYSSYKNSFDLIFCRNVLIYFTPGTIQAIADNCYQAASDKAVLLISHSESLQNIKTKWKSKKPSIYIKGLGLY